MRLFDFFRPRAAPRWEGRIAIAEFLRTWDGRAALPDEDTTQIVRFAPGARDGIWRHHGGLAIEPTRIAAIARAVMRAVERNDDESRARLYALALDPVQEVLDCLPERLRGGGIGDVGRWLISIAADREPVKLGLYLVALTRDDASLPLVRLFARHEEFTKFALFGLLRLTADPIAELLALAKELHGWGKIDLVEKLAERGADRAEVRDWLLRRGCANAVMDEYLAYVCAAAGRLHEALAAESIDDELLRGASTIVTALFRGDGGPANGISDYEDGEDVVLALLRHLDARPSFESATTAGEILRCIELDPKLTERFGDDVRARCRSIIATTTPDELRRRFIDADLGARADAWALAPAVGVDLWEDAFALLERAPTEASLYQWLLATDDAMRLRRIVVFAEQQLPLRAIATGAAEEHGLGAGFEPHACLDELLQRMQRGDVFSDRLVMAALLSPVIRNRNLAAAAIAARKPRLSQMLTDALRIAAEIEPNADVRKRLSEVV